MTSIHTTAQTLDAATRTFPAQSGDCLEASTCILMDDGSLRPIREVRLGDNVSSGNGPSAVVDIVRGRESKIVRVETDKGAILRASAAHLVATPTGLKRAVEIAAGDLVATPEGGTGIVTACNPEYGEFDVFNLILREAASLFVDGFVVGDFDTQLGTACEQDEASEGRIPEEYLAEAEQLRQSQ